MAYDYEQLDSLLDDAAREAAFADLTRRDGWDYDNGKDYVVKTENYGESSSVQTVFFDGRATLGGYNIGVTSPTEPFPSLAEEYAGMVSGWRSKLDQTVSGWDGVPRPTVLDDAKAQCLLGVQKLAGGTGNGGAQFGNPDLEAIGYIRKFIPSPDQAGQTISAFYTNYGPERLETVLDGQCEAVAALGVAITGTQKLFETCREDVANLVGNVKEAFKQTRKDYSNLQTIQTVLTVAQATAGVLGVFIGPGVGTAAIGGLSAGTSFLSTALGLLPKPTEAKLPYSGSSPNDVYNDFKKAFSTLEEKAKAQDEGLDAMLENMLAAVVDPVNRLNFHVHPGQGEAAIGDTIDVKYQTLEHIGYESMPTVARAFLQAADQVESSNQVNAWIRTGIVGLGTYGCYFTWRDLAHQLTPLLNDTGAEVVRAGESLAEAAGYLRDSDGWAKDKLGANYKELEGAELGWQDPYVPPPPPPRPHGGPQPY